jgi:hypothetical protein
MISISAFARDPFVSDSDLSKSGRTHDISDARAGGGGEDKHRELMSVQVTDTSGPATGATCSLTNDKGEWSTTAPGKVEVLRSTADLTIVCSKEGYNAETLVISPASMQIQPKRFRFQGDSDTSDDLLTVPYYDATVTLHLTAAVTPSSAR